MPTSLQQFWSDCQDLVYQLLVGPARNNSTNYARRGILRKTIQDHCSLIRMRGCILYTEKPLQLMLKIILSVERLRPGQRIIIQLRRHIFWKHSLAIIVGNSQFEFASSRIGQDVC